MWFLLSLMKSHLPMVLKIETVKILKKMFGIQFLPIELMVLTIN